MKLSTPLTLPRHLSNLLTIDPLTLINVNVFVLILTFLPHILNTYLHTVRVNISIGELIQDEAFFL